jgi:hypothetical protein
LSIDGGVGTRISAVVDINRAQFKKKPSYFEYRNFTLYQFQLTKSSRNSILWWLRAIRGQRVKTRGGNGAMGIGAPIECFVAF